MKTKSFPSVTQVIKEKVIHIQTGKPFTNTEFLHLGTRAAVDKVFSRLVKAGILMRVAQGVFMRPKKSIYVENIPPSISEVVQNIAKKNNEIIQVHGAEAARRLGLTTQVPGIPIFYTSGISRILKIGNQLVTMRHASPKKLALAGKPAGDALSALAYLGRPNISNIEIAKVKSKLEPYQYELLTHAKMSGWLREAFNKFERDSK